MLGINNPPDIKGDLKDLFLEVGETQLIMLGKASDEDQEEGLNLIYKFDGSESFPAWITNNYDMSFLV